MDTFILGEIGESLPLRAREAEIPGALFEALAQESGDVMEQKAQGRLDEHR
jgi:hypothetical protein